MRSLASLVYALMLCLGEILMALSLSVKEFDYILLLAILEANSWSRPCNVEGGESVCIINIINFLCVLFVCCYRSFLHVFFLIHRYLLLLSILL